MHVTLVGKLFKAVVRMWTKTDTYTVSDHYAEYEREYSVGIGDVAVFDTLGRRIAFVHLDYKGREPGESAFSQCVVPRNLLPDQEADYVDWFARRIMRAFGEHSGEGELRMKIEKPDQEELFRLGFVSDGDGQTPLPLAM